MDYDDDGVLDIISGSYDPGGVYLIRGLGEGTYAAVESITDQEDTPLVHHPEEMKRHLANSKASEDSSTGDSEDSMNDQVASFGSWVTPMDWDADGDLDMLIGTFAGQIFLRTNVGTRESPQYDPISIKVFADGKPFKVATHASPVAADWNDDGLVDLVVASGDGSVGWYENSGTAEQPKFGAKRFLVAAPAGSIFLMQYLYPGETSVPGTRVQICVSDYNGDGRLDLLVGDFSSRIELDKDWPAERKAELFAAFHKSEQSMKRSATFRKESADKYLAAQESDDIDVKDVNLEYQEELERLTKEMENDKPNITKKNEKFMEQLFNDAPAISKVWLYLRKSE